MKTLVEVVESKAREPNTRMTAASVRTTRTNLTKGIVKIIAVITLEAVFKRG